MKHFFLVFICLIIASCSRSYQSKYQSLSYEKIFQHTLGTNIGQIGSNIPILKAYSYRKGLTDSFLVDTPKVYVRNKKLYIADTYNKRISVFAIQNRKKHELLLTISNASSNYNFARPYDIYVDRNDNIFVTASVKDFESYEVQHYTNSTPTASQYDEFQKNIQKIPAENFFIYKFSSTGDFITKFGLNGKPFPQPNAIDGDNFNNLYVYMNYNSSTDKMNHIIYRYNSLTGNLNFQFESDSITISTNISGTNYRGSILGIKNFIHDEQLLLLTEYQPTTNSNGEIIPPLIDNIWSSVNVYSILENDFTSTIFKTKNISEDILGVDVNGRVFFQSYNIENESIQIRILNNEFNDNKIFYAPVHSSYYILNNYFIDVHGNIFNSLVDKNTDFILLKWYNKYTKDKS